MMWWFLRRSLVLVCRKKVLILSSYVGEWSLMGVRSVWWRMVWKEVLVSGLGVVRLMGFERLLWVRRKWMVVVKLCL